MKMKYLIGTACLCVSMNMLSACGDDDTPITDPTDPTEKPDGGNTDKMSVT